MAFGKHWEWRGFGRLSPALRRAIEHLPLKFKRAQEITDHYLYVPGAAVNIKVRSNDLKFKRLLESVDCLERWLEDEAENHAFPLAAHVLDKLARDFGLKRCFASGAPLGREELLDLLGRTEPRVELIAVHKVRWQHDWVEAAPLARGEQDPVTVELADLRSPESITSVGLEHASRERLAAAMGALGLPGPLLRLSYLGALAIWARGGKVLGEA